MSRYSRARAKEAVADRIIPADKPRHTLHGRLLGLLENFAR